MQNALKSIPLSTMPGKNRLYASGAAKATKRKAQKIDIDKDAKRNRSMRTFLKKPASKADEQGNVVFRPIEPSPEVKILVGQLLDQVENMESSLVHWDEQQTEQDQQKKDSQEGESSDEEIEEVSSTTPKDNWDSFVPNVHKALRIFLTMMPSVAGCERSFSKMKILKSVWRSTMTNTRLSDLALLSIESDVTENMNFEDIIADFAAQKARKRAI